MKKFVVRIIIGLFLTAVVAGVLKDKLLDSPDAVSKRYALSQNGNVLIYKLYFLSILPMGELTFSRQISDENIFAYLEATTKDCWIHNLIQARATLESYGDPQTLLPDKFVEKTDVKGKIKTKEILFDQQSLIASRENVKLKIPQDTYDPVSAFMQAIRLDYVAGETKQTKFLSKRDIYVLKSTLIKEEKGLLELEIDIKRENLTSSHGANFHVWVTSDDKRAPLLFKALTPAGYFSVVFDRSKAEVKQ